LQEELVDLKKASIQDEVENRLLKANSKILSKTLLNIQNNIEIFKNNFCHFSQFVKNAMNSYELQLIAKEE